MLASGFRALQLSTCMCELGFLTNQFLTQDAKWGLENSNLGFCHMPCGVGLRDPKDLLINLKKFMETNPREVVIIQFDMGEVTSTYFCQALCYSGLLEHVMYLDEEYYIEEWPILQ